MAKFVVDPIGEHAQRDAKLRSSKPHARSVPHRVRQILDELVQFLVEVHDLRRWRAKDRVTE